MRAWEFIAEARDQRESDPRIIQDVKDAYDMGYTAEQSAELLGLTFSAVKRILQAHYSDRDRSQRERKPNDLADAVVNRYKQGQHKNVISKELGIPLRDINVILHTHYPDRPDKRIHQRGRIDRLSDQDRQAIVDAWRKGTSISALAKQYDQHSLPLIDMIKNIVGDNEYNDHNQALRRTTRRVITPDEISNIINAYQSGRKVDDIGREYGVLGNTIKAHLVKQGVFQGKVREPLTKQQIATAKTMRDQGYSIAQIAAKLGMNFGTGRYYLSAAGIH